MARPYTSGTPVNVWVLLKSKKEIIDPEPHMIRTVVTNGFNCWFSRTVTTAVCGKKRAARQGWRSVRKLSHTKGLPENYCQACYRIDLMEQLAD